eukprot:gene13742-biopygen14123
MYDNCGHTSRHSLIHCDVERRGPHSGYTTCRQFRGILVFPVRFRQIPVDSGNFRITVHAMPCANFRIAVHAIPCASVRLSTIPYDSVDSGQFPVNSGYAGSLHPHQNCRTEGPTTTGHALPSTTAHSCITLQRTFVLRFTAQKDVARVLQGAELLLLAEGGQGSGVAGVSRSSQSLWSRMESVRSRSESVGVGRSRTEPDGSGRS